MISPDGNRVLYTSESWTEMRQIVAALDGSKRQQINDGASIAWNNRWSPDGKRIAFTSRNDPKSELAIFIVNADGSERHPGYLRACIRGRSTIACMVDRRSLDCCSGQQSSAEEIGTCLGN
jgi:dipeptidyl aminopeptidase/acylaminoacyl peptidase